MDTIETIYQGKAELAEGPIWYQDRLWWVNIKAGTLNCLNPENGLNTSRSIGEFLGFAAPPSHPAHHPSVWTLGCHQSIKTLNWDTGELITIQNLPISKDLRINDGKRDHLGNLWFGTLSLLGETKKASLYCLNVDGQLHRVKTGISLSNGIDWLADGRMLHVDSETKCIYRYAIREHKIEAEDIFFDFSNHKGSPDGLSVSKDGHVFVSMWGAGCVYEIDAQSRTIIQNITVPSLQPSSCCFNTDQSVLYVTSAWEGLSEETRRTQPENGNIFSIRRT